ncbi:DNA cytosine methyltransferase [Aureispira anguillae]|uniref:Cytosine-specific methyltransferase n=1 Tax=Aureispira anguillae TaxID=2864201 RepID=A0A915YD05_9BACT|nr:DNA (cytosine-5-)-methyltransferase [Aureispira anguillae]BDS10832.1 DNA (cytosine-5-)-methyltransferase [Aureispira anguillae]
MKLYNQFEVSNLLDTPLHRLDLWARNGKLIPFKINKDEKLYTKESLLNFNIAQEVFNTNWTDFTKIKPKRKYTSIELFAGAGGMAIGMEKAGFKHILLNENNKEACATLRHNRPKWEVIEGDIEKVDFKSYNNKIDIITGGFPCQAFSHAGKQLGFEDTRGTLFFEFARCINEVKPKIFIGENVKGLLNHDKGNTLSVIKQAIKDLGYTLIEPKVLKAMYYKVPQKRERLILVGIRNDFADKAHLFKFPEKYPKVLTVNDAFKKGILYKTNVPESLGVSYPQRKKEIMEKVPEGGYWKDLPDDLQKEYMGGSYYLGGGKTGLARRLSLKTPALTIVCSPAMKQTERCHPTETRPLTIRESARIQTFPDEWVFQGAKGQQYKQIGNAVPVNLAYAIGLSAIDFLNKIEK